ncbi:hypothetical protein SIO70_11650 [Chitinophaga sancti]|uniref:hypothetical protein n=1 Tax=Chitinophaga sancti TaxID=1004 RepID=UPI002A7565AB|nr:hypothetical protein [Chitinophaga sancti]WPQ65502.1 hypothetical protein SIO70_11650 [Chitinophaga sancti]
MTTIKLTPNERRKYAFTFLKEHTKFLEKIRMEGVIGNKVYCWNGTIALVVTVEEETEKVYAEIDNEVKIMFFRDLNID